ncbi:MULTISPECIES: hypothetical protein [Pectobacterium]|uniref:hypothetical protein n=1 Tax=Pectobacterium TaxID=122277 RepID=UPI001386C3FF|nr:MULTISPECIES: hypothetical protein [Pectobacterium]UEQ08252.1 hypothetical protein LLE50_15540 [Pectobacterium versatile]
MRQNRRYTAPACGFRIIKIFQFSFSTNQPASPRRYWAGAFRCQLKSLKRISAFFSFGVFCRFRNSQKNYAISLILKTGYYFTWRGEKNQAEKRMCSRSGNPLQDAAYRWAEVLASLKNVNSQAQKNPTGEVGFFHEAWDSLPQIKRG